MTFVVRKDVLFFSTGNGKWFDEWNTRGADLTWDVKQFFHKNNQTIVEWYFKNKMNDGSVEAFDGMSLIQWTVIIGFVF